MPWREVTIELAWAAGFFDGEGSVGTTPNTGRESVRIFAAVPQATPDPAQVPAVLRRFDDAVRGLGRIGSPYLDRRTGTYLAKWRTDNLEEVQAVLALLWPQLGSVKRAQATRALTTFQTQYATIRARRPRTGGRPKRLPLETIGPPCADEHASLAWAAGLFDAEGSTELHRRRAGGRTFLGARSKVSQCDANGVPEVLRRFADTVSCGWIEGPASGSGYANAYKWGAGARDTLVCLDKLWPYLGEVKRAQALHVLASLEHTAVERRHPWRADAASFIAMRAIREPSTAYPIAVPAG